MAQMSFEGRVAVVTGAGGGLGRQHALLLARRGAQVVVNDVGGSVNGTGTSAAPAQAVAAEITAAGGVAVADTHDITSAAAGEAIISTALDAFGRVDVIVNNAGILRDRTIVGLTDDEWDAVLAVHLDGAYQLTRAAWRSMRDQGYGRIVNTTSSVGLWGNYGQANYGAAKMGLVGLTKVSAHEGAKYGIKANAIAPVARTRMTEDVLGALVEHVDPALVSPAVAFLAHEDCPVSGEVVSVGGGRIARVFVAVTPGYFSETLSPEEIRDQWDWIRCEDGYQVPASTFDEIAILRDRLEASDRSRTETLR